jgi:hypothetical protein
MKHPQPTKYLNDFLAYYQRAKLLEDRNHRNGRQKSCGDPLQDNVTIYDTVHRRYAGFSNVLRDLHDPSRTKTRHAATWQLKEWLYIYGVHRMTGSGASFYPKSEPNAHGYCNTPIFEMVGTSPSIKAMAQALANRFSSGVASFTSLGNQPPPFPKPKFDYKTGGAYYLCEVWPAFAKEIANILEAIDPDSRPSVASMTDWMLDENVRKGFKRFKFTMTAFVMDIADWHPEYISPLSQCHYGANCITAFNAMFSGDNKTKGKGFYHECMDQLVPLCSEILGEEAAPMDVEDCACDAVRYWMRFVPRHGYDHLKPAERKSLSKIKQQDFMNFCGIPTICVTI